MEFWQILPARVYKCRYHISSMVLQSAIGKQLSYNWKSIHVWKDLLKQGMKIQLGNGKPTNVWSDFWLPTLPPRQATCKFVILVANLWKEEERDNVLTQEDTMLAKHILLSKYAPIWPYAKIV